MRRRRRTRRGQQDAALRATTWRIGVFAATLVVGCVALTAGVLVAVYEHQTRSATRASLAAAAAITDPSKAPPGTYLAIERDARVETTPGMPAGLPDRSALRRVAATGKADERSIDDDGRGLFLVVRTTRVGDRTVEVVLDGTAVEEGSERVLTALVVAGGLGVLLAATGAAILARRAVRPLTDTVALQRQFVADASHELRTPLTLLSTRAQLVARDLARERPDDRSTTAANGVVDDIHALTATLDELLLAVDVHELTPTDVVDLASVVRAVVDAAEAHARAHQVSLDCVLAGDPPTTVVGSVSALRRAVTALVDNALDHAHAHVTVRLDRVGGTLRITVADDGPGIAPDQIDHVFDRFHSARGPVSVTRQGHGLRRHHGLGLALVSEIAATHHGSIVVLFPGDTGGAEFRLALPASTTTAGPRGRGFSGLVRRLGR